MKFKRIFLIVLDSLGIGDAKDAAAFGDEGADTLGHIAERMSSFHIDHLRRIGLANLKEMKGLAPVSNPAGYYLCLSEKSAGKDTLTGHWEMMGLESEKPFKVFTDTGFPEKLIRRLEELTGYECVGNEAASGTEIIERMGERATDEKQLIVYTSADSVLQIAASEEAIGLDEIYRCCRIARDLTMRDGWRVGRVIARPFTGRKKGEFTRTANRRDYALEPPQETMLDCLFEHKLDVIGIGKIGDIFNHRGLTEEIHSESSLHGMEQTIKKTKEDFTGLCFVNLVDFDAKWGHRRDVFGYGREIELFDEKLGKLMLHLGAEDLLMLTADHGNDPTFRGTDHTREDVPLLIWSPAFEKGGPLSGGDSFGLVGATVAENFDLKMPAHCIGRSVLKELI